MPSKYSYTVEAYGRPEHRLDVQSFTKDLAKAMGGEYCPPEEPGDTHDNRSFGRFRFPGDGVKVTVYHGYGLKPEQVSLRLDLEDFPNEVRNAIYGDKYKLPEIKVSVERSLQVLARDIEKRLIQAAQAPLTARRELARSYHETAESLDKAMAEFRAAFPGARLDVVSNSKQSATFYISEPYVSGTLFAEGSVTINHMASLPRGKLVRLVALLRE